MESLSIRTLADRYRCTGVRFDRHWRARHRRKTPAQVAPKLDALKPVIDAMLTEDLVAPPKRVATTWPGVAGVEG